MTDTHQPDRLTVATLEAIIVRLLKQCGRTGDVFGPREMREARLTELVVICHAGGAVSVGVGDER
jgi:hypothetical protein